MFKFFRIFFAILAASAVASSILLGIFLGMIYFIIIVALSIFFFGLCLLFKQLCERQENKNKLPPTDKNIDVLTNLEESATTLSQEIANLQQKNTQDLTNASISLNPNANIHDEDNSLQ